MSAFFAKLGTLGKGFATLSGAILGVGGLFFGGGDKLAECVKYLSQQPASGAAALGILLALFGVGRKAGWIASNGR